jgi:hypothetical protein
MLLLNLFFCLVHFFCPLVYSVPVVSAASSIDGDNPSKADPTAPIVPISFPSRAPQPASISSQPEQCDAQNPSADCFNALSSSGGYLWFDKDSGCSDDQKASLETAVWDATTLAFYSSTFPSVGDGPRALQAGIFYMGHDVSQFQSRISGNLGRAWQFKTGQTSSKEYITVSCKDTKAQCGRTVQGKAVGGYAWTYNGYFGYYHYITFCPTFFTLETLDTKLNDVSQELGKGVTTMATDMTWLRTTGQYFLHELMHTRLATGAGEPDIIDQTTFPGVTRLKAYGPALVHALAGNVGASKASTNADSYAMLANAIWWWDTTGYFPGIPTAKAQNDFVQLSIDLGNITDPTIADFSTMFDADLSTFDNTTNPQSPTIASSQSPPTPPPSVPTPPPPPSPPTDSCEVSYDVFLDTFHIMGKNFDVQILGEQGEGLEKKIKSKSPQCFFPGKAKPWV